MEEIKRKIDVLKLKIKYIDDRGYYADIDNNIFFKLNDEEIDLLRSVHRNPNIAKKRLVSDKKVKVRVYNEESIRRSKKVKIDNKKRKMKKRPNKKGFKEFIIRLGLGTIIAGGLYLGYNGLTNNDNDNVEIVEVSNDDIIDFNNEIYEADNNVEVEEVEVDLRITPEMIKKYCDIYQVNYDVVYSILSNLTGNFSNQNYIDNCNIEGIVCKGVQVHPESYEQLLIYTIRNIKQDPSKFGLTKEMICINNGYQSSTNYLEEIKRFSEIFGIDECLVAAIVKSETGFDSQMFHDINNPAGLRLSTGWWEFSTKEEGFIELCLEIIKYYKQIGVDKNYVDANTIAKIGSIHAPLSDGNIYWLDNVTQSYEDYKENWEDYFDEEKVNTGISL